MQDETPCFHREGEDLLLLVKVQPGAHRDELAGVIGGTCKIRINAPPVDGKANARLIKFLAKQFAVSKSRVVIETGHSGRNKRIRIINPGCIPRFSG